MTIELTIWDGPVDDTGDQAQVPQVVQTVEDPEQVGQLVDAAYLLGFTYCTEILGRYLFTHQTGKRTACIAVRSPL